jgi:hypothetical protein
LNQHEYKIIIAFRLGIKFLSFFIRKNWRALLTAETLSPCEPEYYLWASEKNGFGLGLGLNFNPTNQSKCKRKRDRKREREREEGGGALGARFSKRRMCLEKQAQRVPRKIDAGWALSSSYPFKGFFLFSP